MLGTVFPDYKILVLHVTGNLKHSQTYLIPHKQL